MYFRIPDYVALRSWPGLPYACYVRYNPYASPLSKEEYEAMLRCDGEQEVDPDAAFFSLLMNKLIEPCEKGEHPCKWSLPVAYP